MRAASVVPEGRREAIPDDSAEILDDDTSGTPRKHFLQERCTWTWDRLPWTTSVLAVVETVVFRWVPRRARWGYSVRNPDSWWEPWTYAFFHLDSTHLGTNMGTLLLSGVVLEATDSNLRMLLVVCTTSTARQHRRNRVSKKTDEYRVSQPPK